MKTLGDLPLASRWDTLSFVAGSLPVSFFLFVCVGVIVCFD